MAESCVFWADAGHGTAPAVDGDINTARAGFVGSAGIQRTKWARWFQCYLNVSDFSMKLMPPSLEGNNQFSAELVRNDAQLAQRVAHFSFPDGIGYSDVRNDLFAFFVIRHKSKNPVRWTTVFLGGRKEVRGFPRPGKPSEWRSLRTIDT
jgi:hypothetical protein